MIEQSAIRSICDALTFDSRYTGVVPTPYAAGLAIRLLLDMPPGTALIREPGVTCAASHVRVEWHTGERGRRDYRMVVLVTGRDASDPGYISCGDHAETLSLPPEAGYLSEALAWLIRGGDMLAIGLKGAGA
jgi:hypothetical protein